MKLVILGAGGQLGGQLAKTFGEDAAALTRADADLTRPAELRQTLLRLQSRVVVNAAGFTNVERAEAVPADAFAVNALALRDLAILCRDIDCALVHFSTDYVFGLDAHRSAAYSETDEAGPVNVYGASKLAGELFVRSLCPKHFILRTCGLYGAGGPNFVETMLRKADEGGPIRVVDDQVCTPTSAFDLAAATKELIESQAYGVYHITNAGACTWHEFAAAIFEMARKDAPLVPIKSAEYPSNVQRPHFSVLSNAKWLDAGFAPLPPWREALRKYLAQKADAS